MNTSFKCSNPIQNSLDKWIKDNLSQAEMETFDRRQVPGSSLSRRRDSVQGGHISIILGGQLSNFYIMNVLEV